MFEGSVLLRLKLRFNVVQTRQLPEPESVVFQLCGRKLVLVQGQATIQVNRPSDAIFDMAIGALSLLFRLHEGRFKIGHVKAHAAPLEDASTKCIVELPGVCGSSDAPCT